MTRTGRARAEPDTRPETPPQDCPELTPLAVDELDDTGRLVCTALLERLELPLPEQAAGIVALANTVEVLDSTSSGVHCTLHQWMDPQAGLLARTINGDNTRGLLRVFLPSGQPDLAGRCA